MRRKVQRVAREAAHLLYSGAQVEYKDAKIAAGKSLGIDVLPSNYDVARELDLLSEEMEGKDRERLLLRLRQEALLLMEHLADLKPRLIGSVWRGTARKGSDIDLRVYASDIDEVVKRLSERFQVTKAEWTSRTSEGRTIHFYHVFTRFRTGDEAEVSVRNPEEMSESWKDAVYGDEVSGFTLEELEAVVRADPLRKFVPEKRKARRVKR